MKVIVCCKSVPEGITGIRFSEAEGRIVYDNYSMAMNESDEYALEQALVLKKCSGAEVTIVTAGELKSQDSLYLALAKGADNAIRIDLGPADSGVTAEILAGAIKRMGYDLVLTGVESNDNMAAQVGVSVAERLGLPYAHAVTKVEVAREGVIKVVKELAGGMQQALELDLPALLCVQSSTLNLSGVAVAKLLLARKRKSIAYIGMADLEVNLDELNQKRLKIVGAFTPPSGANTEIINGSPGEVAQVLINKMKQVLK